MKSFITSLKERFTDLESKVLWSTLVIVLGVWGFIELADEVTEGSTRTLDTWLLESLRNLLTSEDTLSRTTETIATDLTSLGSYAVLTLIVGCVLGFLLLKRAFWQVAFILGATLGGAGLVVGLKEVFGRPRPETVAHLVEVTSHSFPSGHAMASAVIYLTLGALMAAFLDERPTKIYVLVVSFLLTVLVGLSRIVLGVHYPTDVLAGWIGGVVWALLCWTLFDHFQGARGEA